MRIFPVVAAAALIGGCAQTPDTPQAKDAWIRLSAIPGRPAAAYFTLVGGKTADALVGVSTPAASRAELHESMKNENGMMTMQPLKSVPLAAGGTVKFTPGAKHVMLFDVGDDVRPGSSIPMTLKLVSGTTIQITARVVAAGQSAPD